MTVNYSTTRQRAAKSSRTSTAATDQSTTRAKTSAVRDPMASIRTSRTAARSSISARAERRWRAASVRKASSSTCWHSDATGLEMSQCHAELSSLLLALFPHKQSRSLQFSLPLALLFLTRSSTHICISRLFLSIRLSHYKQHNFLIHLSYFLTHWTFY